MSFYSGLKLQRYGVTNALMYYLYTTGVAALSHFYFNPLYFRNEFSGSLEWCRLPEKQSAKQKDGFLIRPFRISNTAKCPA